MGMKRVPQHRFLVATTDDNVVVLRFTGNVGWDIDSRNFGAALDEAEANYAKVIVEVHSPGGSVFEGWAIYNRLLRSSIDTETKCVGLAASMGSVVMMAGKKITMCESSIMMIHEPWTFTYGNAADLRKEADTLETVSKVLAKSYTKRTKLTAKQVAEMMAKETWLSPEDAKNGGFIDNIDEGGDEDAPAKFGAMGKKELVAYARSTMPDQNQQNNPDTKPVAGSQHSNINSMDLKMFIAILGLTSMATNEEVYDKVKALVIENKSMATTLKTLEEQQKAAAEASINNVINTAITEGRITEAERADFTELGKVNMKLLQSTVNARPKASDLVPTNSAFRGTATDERNAWTLEDWMKKDPAGLETMAKTDPARHAEILKKG